MSLLKTSYTLRKSCRCRWPTDWIQKAAALVWMTQQSLGNSEKGTGNRKPREMGDHIVWKGRRFHVQTHSRSHTQVLAGHDESSVDSTFMLW